MKKIFFYMLAVILLPFYPVLSGRKKVADKMHVTEKIVVVIRSKGKKRTLTN